MSIIINTTEIESMISDISLIHEVEGLVETATKINQAIKSYNQYTNIWEGMTYIGRNRCIEECSTLTKTIINDFEQLAIKTCEFRGSLHYKKARALFLLINVAAETVAKDCDKKISETSTQQNHPWLS